MISFLIAIAILLLGYFTYGKIVERNFSPDDRETPAVKINDKVDYIVMPTWKVFLIELLNIAGTGPIFGAISGALFGPVVYIWIVFGCVFAGAVHDYYCGMLSMRHNGASVSELTGIYLGNTMKQVMRVFSIILLVMCGVVFTTGPAGLLEILTPSYMNHQFWLIVIIIYYFVATFLPIDKVIGRFYPIFGVCLIITALGVSGSMLFSGKFEMPEVWNCFSNMHAKGIAIWPFMCITVACGAISGFHATQSPMMARCCKNEYVGHKVFYGAMIAEGIIALVWAAAGVTCFESSQVLLEAGGGCSEVVYTICQSTMGKIGGVLALIGVVVCPISSGDTAYRSARLTIADALKLDQSKIKNRFFITFPLLAVGCLIVYKIDYSIIWRYCSWSNQTLAMIVLWVISIYLANNNKKYIFTLFPAMFMTAVSVTYFFAAPECMGLLWNKINLPYDMFYPAGVIFGIIMAIVFFIIFMSKNVKKENYSNK